MHSCLDGQWLLRILHPKDDAAQHIPFLQGVKKNNINKVRLVMGILIVWEGAHGFGRYSYRHKPM